MEMNNELLKQSQQLSQADGAAYSQELQLATKVAAETSIGRRDYDKSYLHILSGDTKYTVMDAWYGCNIQKAMRHPNTFELIKHQFKLVLLEMNCDHPWTNKLIGDRQVQRIIDFDPTWTMEDFGLFFEMTADGKLALHYGKPNRDWWHRCQVAYNELKYEAREEIARQAKAKAQVEEMKAADPQWTTDAPSKPRTMAEFLSGKNYLSAMDRAEMAERDKARKS